MKQHAMKRHAEGPPRAPADPITTELRAPGEEWLTDQDVFEVYKIPRGTLRYYRSVGIGPAYTRLSARVCRYRRADVEAWLEANTVRPERSAS